MLLTAPSQRITHSLAVAVLLTYTAQEWLSTSLPWIGAAHVGTRPWVAQRTSKLRAHEQGARMAHAIGAVPMCRFVQGTDRQQREYVFDPCG